MWVDHSADDDDGSSALVEISHVFWLLAYHLLSLLSCNLLEIFPLSERASMWCLLSN